MNNTGALKCPNCGGTRFADTERESRRCEYCGTVIESRGVKARYSACPRCGFDNGPGTRYCGECGLALEKWPGDRSKKLDLAVISVAVTVFGSVFVPIGGAILGLFLAYKARDLARAADDSGGSPELARFAIVVGWAVLGISILPMCLFPLFMGGQIGLSACGAMSELRLVASGL